MAFQRFCSRWQWRNLKRQERGVLNTPGKVSWRSVLENNQRGQLANPKRGYKNSIVAARHSLPCQALLFPSLARSFLQNPILFRAHSRSIGSLLLVRVLESDPYLRNTKLKRLRCQLEITEANLKHSCYKTLRKLIRTKLFPGSHLRLQAGSAAMSHHRAANLNLQTLPRCHGPTETQPGENKCVWYVLLSLHPKWSLCREKHEHAGKWCYFSLPVSWGEDIPHSSSPDTTGLRRPVSPSLSLINMLLKGRSSLPLFLVMLWEHFLVYSLLLEMERMGDPEHSLRHGK